MTVRKPFEVYSFIGSDIAQLGYGERPPRSAKFIASLDMGSGPGGGDYRTYLLSTDKERSGWTLWHMAHDYDTGKRLYCRVAQGGPYRGYPAKYAAEQLLTKVWLDETDEGLYFENVLVEEAGLLTAEDIQRVALAVIDD